MDKQIKIVMLCAAGMSSSLVCSRIAEAAKKKNVKIEISATPIMTYKELEYDNVDLVILAPQVRFQIAEVKTYLDSYQVPVLQIGYQEYGMLEGNKILDNILATYNK